MFGDTANTTLAVIEVLFVINYTSALTRIKCFSLIMRLLTSILNKVLSAVRRGSDL